MDPIKITDNFQEQIQLGKELFASKSKVYTKELVDSMYKEIRSLMTPKMASDFTEEDIFFHSIYDFWVYGNTTSEEIYLRFLYKTHKEKIEFTTFRTSLWWMFNMNDRSFQHVFHNKWETYELFSKYYLRDVIKISSEEDYSIFEFFVSKHPIFVLKPISSHLGIGVQKIDSNNYNDLKSLFKELLNIGVNLSKDSFYNDSDLILEELIDQDQALAAIHPYSVNGIRITTYRKNGKITILYPWFKVGANKQFVTSASFGTYDAGIDAVTGVVNTDGFLENGESDSVHPLTGFKFKGYRIPKWDNLVETVKEMALSLPEQINYVGWDMVLTPKGWCIMEGNFSGAFMWQMFNQKGFRKEIEGLTGLVFGNEYWWQKNVKCKT